jgi:hypothetical protein
MGIISMNTDTIIERRSLIGSFDWNSSSAIDTPIYSGEFPRALFKSNSFPAMEALKIHEFISAQALEFTLQASASPFVAGILQMIWTPSNYGQTNWSGISNPPLDKQRMINFNNMIDTSSLLLNLGEGNTATLTVPLTNILPVLRTQFLADKTIEQMSEVLFDPNNFNFWGRIRINVFNILQGADEEDQRLGLKLWATLKQPKLALLRAPHGVVRALPIESEYEGIILSVAAIAGGIAASAATAVAAAAPAIAVSAVTAGTVAAASSFGHSVGKHCTYYNEIGESPMTMNLSLSNDRRAILSLGYDTRDFSDSTTDLQDAPPELDCKWIASRRSRISTITNWDSTTAIGAVLSRRIINPAIGAHVSLVDSTDAVLTCSNMCHVSNYYSYWRGSISLTYEVVGNSYSRGALLLVYLPTVDTPNPTTIEAATAFPHAIINIAEIRKFTFRIPFNSTTPWLRVPRLVASGGTWVYPDTSDNIGVATLFVLNQLRSNEATKITTYPINIYVHSDDIDFRVPDPNRNLAVASWTSVPPEPLFEMCITHDSDTEPEEEELPPPIPHWLSTRRSSETEIEPPSALTPEDIERINRRVYFLDEVSEFSSEEEDFTGSPSGIHLVEDVYPSDLIQKFNPDLPTVQDAIIFDEERTEPEFDRLHALQDSHAGLVWREPPPSYDHDPEYLSDDSTPCFIPYNELPSPPIYEHGNDLSGGASPPIYRKVPLAEEHYDSVWNIAHGYQESLLSRIASCFYEGNLEAEPLPTVDAFGTPSNPTRTSLMPTTHTDLRQLLTRRTALATGEVDHEYTLITIPLPCAGKRGGLSHLGSGEFYPVPSFYNAFSQAFAWQTGSQILNIMFGNNVTEQVNVIAQVIYNGDQDWSDAVRRSIAIEGITSADYLDVADEDASIILNSSVNNRHEFGIPWYNMVQMLSTAIMSRTTADISTVQAAYMPMAMLRLFIHSPFVGENLKFTISTSVGPNFQFSQFMGCPNMICYEPITLTTAIASSRREPLRPRNIARVRIPQPRSAHHAEQVPSVLEMNPKLTYTPILCATCGTTPKTFSAYIQHLVSSHPRVAKDLRVNCFFCHQTGNPMIWDEHNPVCLAHVPRKCGVCHHRSTTGELSLHHVINNHSHKNFMDEWFQVTGTGRLSHALSAGFSYEPSIAPIAPQRLEFEMMSMAQKLTKILPEENLQGSINEMLEYAASMKNDVSDLKSTVQATIIPSQIKETIFQFQETTKQANSTFAGISQMTNNINAGLEWFLNKVKEETPTSTFSSANKTRLTANAMRAIKSGNWEPILSDIFIELIDRFSPINPGLVTLGLKGILAMIAPDSNMHLTLNAIILTRATEFVSKFIPAGWTDFFKGSFFESEQDDAFNFTKAMLLFFGFCGTVLTGIFSPLEYFRDFKKNFSFLNLSRAAQSLATLMDAMSQLWKWIQEKVFGRSVWAGHDWIMKNRDTVANFQSDYIEFTKFTLNKVLNSPILRSQAIKLGETAKMISANLALIKNGNNEVTTLQKQCEYFIQLAKQSRQVPPGKIRTRPTVLTLQGDSQCGKTYLASTILPHYINEMMRWPQEAVFMVSSSTDDFMSGYSQQMITTIDDFLQMKEGDDLKGFVNMVGNGPYRVNMADINEKGTQFLSEVVILTMNVPHPKIDKFVNKPEAIYNRMYDFYFHVQPNKDYMLPGGRLNVQKVKENGVTFQPDAYLEFYRQQFIDGERKPEIRDELQGKRFSFFEIVRYLCENIAAEEESVEDFHRNEDNMDLPSFPDNFLPENWDDRFTVLEMNSSVKTRAMKINEKVIQLAKASRRAYSVTGNLIRENMEYLARQGYSDNILMNLNWTNLMQEASQENEVNLHLDPSFEDDYINNTNTAWWHKCRATPRVNISFTGPFNNPIFRWCWQKLQTIKRLNQQFKQAYPDIWCITVNVVVAVTVSLAVECITIGTIAMVDWIINPAGPKPTTQSQEDEQVISQVFSSAGTEATWYNAGSPQGGARAKVRVLRPKAAKQAPKVPTAKTESDVPEMFHIIKRNCVEVKTCALGPTFSMRALGWKKDLLITNRHFLINLPDGAKITMSRWTPNENGHREEFELILYQKDVSYMEWSEDQPFDIAVWATGWKTATFKDISKHFVRESDVDRITDQPGYRISDIITQFPRLIYSIGEQPFDTVKDEHIQVPLAIVAQGSYGKGLCGSPWIVENTSYFGSTGKICGIHSFGAQNYTGAVPITIEMLEDTELCLPNSYEPSEPTIPTILKNTVLEYHVYHGDVSPKDAFMQPRKTELQPSPIINEVVPVTHEPAVLSDRDRRLEKPKEFEATLLKKTDFVPKWFKDDSEVDQACKSVFEDLAELPINGPTRLLTLDEAINGVDGPTFMQDTGLEMNKSPGYPYNKYTVGKGKYPLFEEVEDPNRRKFKIKDTYLASRVSERLDLAMEGKVIPDSIWLDCMKDELRPSEKCKQGNTRIINAPPVDLMIVMNILFGAFRIFFMDPANVGEPLESALGIDPKQTWPNRGLLLKSALACFGIDFKKFDSTQAAEFYKKIARIINAWYLHNQTDQSNIEAECLARETILFEIGHTLHLFQNVLYTDDHGLPSGVPAGYTTILNIFVNKILARIVYIRTGLHVSTYKKYTKNVFMGDDGEHVVLRNENEAINAALLNYNRVNLAKVVSEIGMTATMPNKSDRMTPFDSFEDMTFLKQSYTDAVIPGYFLPGMSKETIGNLLNWVRPKKNPNQFETNIMEAMKFAAPHGKTYYTQLTNALKANPKIQALYGSRLHQVIPQFEELFYSTYLPFGLVKPSANNNIFGFQFAH